MKKITNSLSDYLHYGNSYALNSFKFKYTNLKDEYDLSTTKNRLYFTDEKNKPLFIYPYERYDLVICKQYNTKFADWEKIRMEGVYVEKEEFNTILWNKKTNEPTKDRIRFLFLNFICSWNRIDNNYSYKIPKNLIKTRSYVYEQFLNL